MYCGFVFFLVYNMRNTHAFYIPLGVILSPNWAC